MKRILTVASLLLLCLGFTSAVHADVDPSTCDHTFYGVYDADHNPVIARYDDEYHYVLTRCSKCQTESTSKGFSHFMRGANWDDGNSCRYFDNQYHERRQKCMNCDYQILTKENHSFSSYPVSVRYLDQNGHTAVYHCYSCDKDIECVEPHSLYSTVEYKKVDDTYHATVYNCSCGYKTLKEENPHIWSTPWCIQSATATVPGLMRYACTVCFATKDVSFPYTPGGDYCSDYLISDDISPVYGTSKSVTIKLNAPLKGGVIQLKFGKKTYKKKITNNGTKIKIKLKKKPKWGTKFSVKLTYNGKVLYSGKQPVLYAKKIRAGMTKKQAKYTYMWGSPQRTGGSSGGWTYWYYEDGSYIGFKNGKVKFWRY